MIGIEADSAVAVGVRAVCPACRQEGALRCGPLSVCQSCGTPFPARHSDHSQTTFAEDALPAGTCLGDRYRIERMLGAGAHGVAYLARHEYLNHPCVVKMLPFPTHFDADAARRLRAEASAGFRVSSPHVVRVLDCDSAKGWWYFVMEYIDGVDLASAAAGTLPWQAVLRIARDAAQGLDAIHRARLLHRDIKPANLLLGADGRVRIADLGVVELTSTTREFAIDVMAGTLGYAAPEVLGRHEAGSVASDLYSLGATLFELACGRPPRDGSLYRVLLDAAGDPLEWPEEHEAPRWFQTAILRLLAHHPGDRPRSAAELLALLNSEESSVSALEQPEVAEEAVTPSGVVILPLENSGESGADWWGQAIAEHVGRVLARGAAEYVVDREQFLQTFGRLDSRRYGEMNRRMLEAGRLTGAGTIVSGQYRVDGNVIECSLAAICAPSAESAPLGVFRAAVMDASRMEAEIAARIRILARRGGELTLTDAGPTGHLAAQEPYFTGKRAFLRGDYSAALLLFEQSLTADPAFADALGYAAICSLRSGRYDDAVRHTDALEALAESRNDARLKVEAAANRGSMCYFRGQYAEAAQHLSRAAEIAERGGLRVELAQVRNNLGFALLQLGQIAEAESTYRLAIQTNRAIGALVFLIGPYNGLGHVLREQGLYDAARGFFSRARALAQECDDRVNIGIAFMNLGQCALLQGRVEDAKAELAAALTLLEETRFWNGLGRVFEYMAELALETERWHEAERCARKRIDLAQRHSNARMEAQGWRQLSRAARGAGREGEAEEFELRAAAVEPARN